MKTRTTFRRGLAAAPLSLLLPGLALAGCAHKPTIVGKWQGNASGPQGGAVSSTFEFTQDGKEILSLQATGGPMSFSMGAGGTYTVSGDRLTQTLTSVTMGAATMPLPSGKSQAETSTFTLDGDRLTLTSPTTHRSLTLTRVKE